MDVLKIMSRAEPVWIHCVKKYFKLRNARRRSVTRCLTFTNTLCGRFISFFRVELDSDVGPYYLHGAVYLYLQTVNQTLAENDTDYQNGRLIHLLWVRV